MIVDHPYTNPGDGRKQCDVCGKYVWQVTHSCKGVRVAPMDGGPSFHPCWRRPCVHDEVTS